MLFNWLYDGIRLQLLLLGHLVLVWLALSLSIGCCMRLPDAQIVDLSPSDPIFHVFFDIESFNIIPQDYDLGRPIIRGIYEHNDRTRRLMCVINFNTDVSNFWEFAAQGLRPVEDTNEAYKLGVNYVIYGITH